MTCHCAHNTGSYGTELIIYLFCLQLKYKSHIMLLRGNHESRQTTQMYGFYEEIVGKKYLKEGVEAWAIIMEACDFLPLAAIIDKHVSNSICHS